MLHRVVVFEEDAAERPAPDGRDRLGETSRRLATLRSLLVLPDYKPKA